MIKMFVMQTCPYCEYVEKQVEGNPHFEVIDISKHVRNDGTVTLSSKDAGLEPMPDENIGASCSIDGSGC